VSKKTQNIDKEEEKRVLKNRNEQKLLGSGGIRTHASEETGALNIRLFSYTLKHYVVYFYEYLCKLKDMRKVFEKNFLSDNTIVQETNGVIVFNM
jgi:hypothetical protein